MAENERQQGIIFGLENMVEEAAAEKMQLLKYCHELELRALAVDMMVQNPPNIAAEHRDAFALLDLQQVSPCQRIITQFSRTFFLAATCRGFLCVVNSQPTNNVSAVHIDPSARALNKRAFSGLRLHPTHSPAEAPSQPKQAKLSPGFLARNTTTKQLKKAWGCMTITAILIPRWCSIGRRLCTSLRRTRARARSVTTAASPRCNQRTRALLPLISTQNRRPPKKLSTLIQDSTTTVGITCSWRRCCPCR
jgi:hypothetical protein